MTIVLMAFTVCAGFTACGDDDDESNNSEPSSSSNQSGQTESSGIKAIDLGLSIKWASCNVGALNPEDLGGRYAWGEIVEKDDYSEKNYSLAKPFETYEKGDWAMKTKVTLYKYQHLDIMGTEYDVAHVKMGGYWRMPTKSECEELANNCKVVETTLKGKRGYKFTGLNGNSIFIPQNDSYNDGCWTTEERTVYYDNYQYGGSTPMQAYVLNDGKCDKYSFSGKFRGLHVRAVTE